jgi:hypothetical protein
MINDSAGVADRRITFAGILAGASFGLFVGAVVLGVSISGGSAVNAVVSCSSFLLGGALVLFPVAFAVGMPVLRVLHRRDASHLTTLATLWMLVLLLALISTLVLGIAIRSPLGSALLVLPATIWCCIMASLGGVILSPLRRTSITIIAIVACLSGVAAVVFAVVR